MRSLFHSLAPALLGFTSLAAQSAEFAPLISTAERIWPDKTRIGVVCDYHYSKDMIASLAQAAQPGTIIHVVDTPSATRLASAQNILRNQKVDYLVLLPRDPVFFEGSFPATMLVGHLATSGIPSVGTRPVGLKQGVVFSIGPDTNGELMVTNKLVGTVSVILPNRSARASQPLESMASGIGAAEGVTVNLLQTAE